MTRFLTHVLLERPSALSVWGLIAEMRRFAPPGFARLEPLAPPASGRPENTILLSVEGIGVVVMFKEGFKEGAAPPSLADLQEEARLAGDEAFSAPTGVGFGGLRAHAAVGLIEEPTDPAAALAGARTVSFAAAAVARIFRAPGVIFSEGRTLTAGPEFVEAVQEIFAGAAPAKLWIGCELREGAEGWGAVTHGLTPFVGRELQIRPCSLSPQAIRRRLTDMARPLIHSGLGFQDGATIALSSGDFFHASHLVASPLTGEPVVELVLEEVLEPSARPRG